MKYYRDPFPCARKKAKSIAASKVATTVFWDVQGIIIFIDYLGKRKTITGEYYATLLSKFYEELKKKVPLKKVLSFHHVLYIYL